MVAVTEDMGCEYFAYGSNMSPKRMGKRCEGAKDLGKAELSDYRFIINKRGVATIVPSEGGTVWGVLWLIGEDHERTLDGCEGVAEGWYCKHIVTVRTEQGEDVQALVYIDPEAEAGKPKKDYLERWVIPGAEHFGLPGEYIEELKSWGQAGRN